MSKHSTQSDYNTWHEKRGYHDELIEPWHVSVSKLIPDLSNKCILEVGCGRGDFSVWLKRTVVYIVLTMPIRLARKAHAVILSPHGLICPTCGDTQEPYCMARPTILVGTPQTNATRGGALRGQPDRHGPNVLTLT